MSQGFRARSPGPLPGSKHKKLLERKDAKTQRRKDFFSNLRVLASSRLKILILSFKQQAMYLFDMRNQAAKMQKRESAIFTLFSSLLRDQKIVLK
jgi:hypothetical protein